MTFEGSQRVGRETHDALAEIKASIAATLATMDAQILKLDEGRRELRAAHFRVAGLIAHCQANPLLKVEGGACG